jgi:hypothetical protein
MRFFANIPVGSSKRSNIVDAIGEITRPHQQTPVGGNSVENLLVVMCPVREIPVNRWKTALC